MAARSAAPPEGGAQRRPAEGGAQRRPAEGGAKRRSARRRREARSASRRRDISSFTIYPSILSAFLICTWTLGTTQQEHGRSTHTAQAS